MDMNYRGGMWEGRGGAEWSGVKGGKWDNCNSIINKYIKKKTLEQQLSNFLTVTHGSKLFSQVICFPHKIYFPM